MPDPTTPTVAPAVTVALPAAKPAGNGTSSASAQPTPKPNESESEFALRLVREQRRTGLVTKERDDARKQVEAITRERDEARTALAAVESAKKLFAEGKYVDALRGAFGIRGLPENILVELASAESVAPEPQTPEQIREQIRAELKAEQDAAREREQEEETQRTAKLQALREAAVTEVAGTLTAEPTKWPTIWALGVTGDQIASKMDELIKPGQPVDPGAVFDALEQEYRERVLSAGYSPKQAAPAPGGPKSFGSDLRRGPVDTAAEPKPPATSRERWAQRDAEWRRQKFGGQ